MPGGGVVHAPLSWIGEFVELPAGVTPREVAAVSDLTVYSAQSPLGKAIAGAKPGETRKYMAPNGRKMSVELIEVKPFTR